MLNGLDLFSGIGGLTVALEPWVQPVAYCEIERYCQSQLLCRMADKEIPTAPIWDDIRTLTSRLIPSVDLVYGGFPCQDTSNSGTKKGMDGERSRLVFELLRLVGELRPSFVFLENVPAITTRGGLRIVSEFTALGYDPRWTHVSAGEIGATQIRERFFLLAYSDGERLERLEYESQPVPAYRVLADRVLQENWPKDASSFSRENNGLPIPVDEVKALGNSVVPAQAREAFKRLMGICE